MPVRLPLQPMELCYNKIFLAMHLTFAMCSEPLFIQSNAGGEATVNAFLNCDLHIIVLPLFNDVIQLLSVMRSSDKIFHELETRFLAQMSSFKSLSESTKLLGATSALWLLANANVDTARWISILAAQVLSVETAMRKENRWPYLFIDLWNCCSTTLSMCTYLISWYRHVVDIGNLTITSITLFASLYPSKTYKKFP